MGGCWEGWDLVLFLCLKLTSLMMRACNGLPTLELKWFLQLSVSGDPLFRMCCPLSLLGGLGGRHPTANQLLGFIRWWNTFSSQSSLLMTKLDKNGDWELLPP